MTPPAASASASAGARWAGSMVMRRPAGRSLARQRLRIVAQRVEVRDDVRPVLGLGEASEGHLGALGEGLRIREPRVEVLDAPLALLRLQGLGEGEAAAALGDGRADDAVEVGADAVRAALVEGVAGGALLRLLLAGIGVGRGEERLDRLGPGRSASRGRRGAARGRAALRLLLRLLGARDDVDRLLRRLRLDEL